MNALLWRMEALRFARNPVHAWIVGGLALLLMASAVWAGIQASQLRERLATSHSAAHRAAAQWRQQAGPADTMGAAAPALSAAQASTALAPRLQLPLAGGLALSLRQADVLGAEIKVGVTSRYTDARNSEQIVNPALLELGLLDFASVLAVLLPLALIGLCYGVVQEDRERGVWRLVCAQMRQPWKLVAAALSVRFLAVWASAVLASALALALDGAATWSAAWHWLLFVTALAAVWTLLAALFLLLPLGSAAAALGLLGLWLATSFAVPPVLAWSAQRQAPSPSRVQAVIELRKQQHQVGTHQAPLLAAWYQAQAVPVPPASASLTPAQQRLPANLALDQGMRPVMLAFDQARAHQAEAMARWAWLSPSLGATLWADQLSGVDARAYLDFITSVNDFEDQWRAFFMPHLMHSTALSAAALERLPAARPPMPANGGTDWRIASDLALLALALSAIVFSARRRFARP